AVEENPALEEVENPPDRLTSSNDEAPAEVSGDPIADHWERYLDRRAADWQPSSGPSGFADEVDRVANLAASESLSAHLLRQIRMDPLSPGEEGVASRIVANLDERGYLQTSVAEIAFESGQDLETTERILHRIQRLDPVGIAARDLRECL